MRKNVARLLKDDEDSKSIDLMRLVFEEQKMIGMPLFRSLDTRGFATV